MGEKLTKGQVFKNWNKVCDWFGWENARGNYKRARLKELESLCQYHKKGNKIIIDEVYDYPKPIEDKRKMTNKQYTVPFYEDNNTGVYIIIDKDNNCYIGSTVRGFKYRFSQHWNNHDGNMTNTYELLHNNKAEFRILHDMSDIKDIALVRMVEDEFIQYYRSLPNYNVVNRTNNAYYKGAIFSEKKKKKQYINIKVDKEDYSEIISLLQENGFLERCIIQSNKREGIA